MKTIQNYPKASSGFTLLELLIALSISLMIILSIGLSYRQMTYTLQKTRQQLEVNNQKITVMKFLDARLKNIKYPDNVPISLYGEANKVSFISDPVASALINSTIKYSIYYDATGKNIMVDTFDMDDKPIDSAVLLERVEGFKLGYFGKPTQESTENLWHTQWENSLQPPLLIKVSIEQFANDIWPDIYIANKLAPMNQINITQNSLNEN